MSPLLSILLRGVGITVLLIVAFLSVFQWGKSACRASYEAAARVIEQQHAKSLDDARRTAEQRAMADREKESRNDKELDQIVREAEGNADLCVSADVLERLRQLQ